MGAFMVRPTVPLLSKDRIRDTALELIDAEGLSALSMRRLAGELGVQAASLYSHVPNKDAVLDAVADLLMRRVDTTGFAVSWQHGLRTWGRSYRDALRAHPNAAPVVAAGTGERADFLSMADGVHGGLLRHGWPPRYATMIAASVKYLVIGASTTPFGSGFADDTRVYLDRYPSLIQAHLIREHAEEIDVESFELALSCLIAGLEPVHLSVRRDQSIES
ncbi:TetR family transcriptional regulator [Nocardioides panaciterrulae]|uniref:AcrR family transcriptional regulator n=1 Tax=Nocardioides panaciterrulae TaxID=661492 RepID=A0A7Y9JC30_9ACTN|nr:TetR family transcriptional regulator [Nocardioides panaciterrulae]NYD41844.1 AcrR family transcriptional regulator [Nocardioides panaciterrulae]